MLVNALRGHLGEFGVVGAKGISRLPDLLAMANDTPVCQLPDLARECIEVLLAQIEDLQQRINRVERSIVEWHRESELSQRLETIPGIGVITATAIAAFVPDADSFRSAHQFAAWIGLVPRLSGTGGKVQLGRISKAGNRYLRRLLTLGATSLVRYAGRSPEVGLDPCPAGAAPDARGDHRGRQQARAHRLGGAQPRRGFPPAASCRGIDRATGGKEGCHQLVRATMT